MKHQLIINLKLVKVGGREDFVLVMLETSPFPGFSIKFKLISN